MHRIIVALLLFVAGAPLAGCIIEDPGPYYGGHSHRWCYYHPGYCR